jgi:hypothetical protein
VVRLAKEAAMQRNGTHALSDVLDRLEQSATGRKVTVEEVVEGLGHRSFAALMLVFSLISTSPASAIPGITAIVAAINFILVVQLILGRDSVWLPRLVTRRKMDRETLCKGIRWLRKPVRFVERFLKPRLTVLLHRPLLWVPLLLILGLTLFMPFMEAVPTSGSLASAIIALFAAGLLTRDGVVVVAAMALLLMAPALVWMLGFA